MSELYGVVGQQNYANLLSSPTGADAIGINVELGSGVIPAGTVMYRKSSGLFAPAANDQISTSYYLVVLAEPIDAGASVEAGAVAPEAKAYRAGCFIDGVVKLASGNALSDANKVVLKLNGIVFDQKVGTANTIENGTVGITYKANNGASPAEEDVVIGAIKGSTYTILNNTDSKLGFTAPVTKSFSKWNTKADGSGTDYAAAASYTASADLVLYAVWATV